MDRGATTCVSRGHRGVRLAEVDVDVPQYHYDDAGDDDDEECDGMYLVPLS
jgi:hypothetical protein